MPDDLSGGVKLAGKRGVIAGGSIRSGEPELAHGAGAVFADRPKSLHAAGMSKSRLRAPVKSSDWV
jgi:hypothetical protein